MKLPWPKPRPRSLIGLLAVAGTVTIGLLLGRTLTKPPADDPGPDDPIRRGSRPW